MILLSTVIVLFAFLEILNLLMLYFIPGTKLGNGIGVFNAYEKSKKDPEVFALVSYLINWVAGTKLIFIALLIVILITADNSTKIYTVLALILSILTFFWRLYPLICKMDKNDQLSPKGYSRTLGIMIFSFIAIFSIALFVAVLC
jgi:hypothetical protein